MKENSTLDLSRGLMCESNLDAYLSRNQSVFCDEDVIIFLNQLYQRTDLSKAALARQAGMSEVYLHQVFSGRRRPSRDRLLCLCICMGASVSALHGRNKADEANAKKSVAVIGDSTFMHSGVTGLIHAIPGYAAGFGWLLPTVLGAGIGVLWSVMRRKDSCP